MAKKDQIRCLLYDVEITKDPFEYANNWGDKHKFPVSTMSYMVLTFRKDDLRIVGFYTDVIQSEEIPQFEKELKRSDCVVTFNGLHFDNPVMEKYLDGVDINALIQYDLMVELRGLVKNEKGRGVQFKLAEVALALKTLKLEDGAKGASIGLWQSNDADDRYKLCRYNIWDVNIMGIFLCIMSNAERGDSLKINKYDKEMKEVVGEYYLDWLEVKTAFMNKFVGEQSTLFDSNSD